MQNRTPDRQPHLLLSAELNDSQKKAVKRSVNKGTLKEMHKGMYTPLPESDWPHLVKAERLRILAALHPGSIFAGVTAYLGGFPDNGVVHLIGRQHKNTELPGLSVRIRVGEGPLKSDRAVYGQSLFMPSEARLLLENLSQSRGPVKRTTGVEGVEKRLLQLLETRGLAAVLALRDSAKDIAEKLKLPAEYDTLNHLVAALNGTAKVPPFKSAKGKALTATPPYDLARVALFNTLARKLMEKPLPMHQATAEGLEAKLNFAFWESYFSNFIEGTEFTLDEAREIVLEGKIVESRPKDSHDILGVYNLAKDPAWSTLTLPASGDVVLDQLRQRHALQMQKRPEVQPGVFKSIANRAGSTQFVEPSLVAGTLLKGAELLKDLPAGTARAIFAMFLVAEVHPFNDGNGRLARLVMNAELSHTGGCRIIVPTLFRDEYVDSLRAMSAGDPEPLISAMTAIQAWTAQFDYADLKGTEELMKRCNAFEQSPVNFKLKYPRDL